jgi:hypothetical protein
MRRDIGRFKWLEGFSALDQRSRVHLQAFGRQVAFILLCSFPMLLIDKHRPALCLFMMRAMFGFSTLFVVSVAVLTRQPVSSKSLCIWDHVVGMLLLTLVCSIALQLPQLR